jgi:hypothetical protein
MSTGCQIADLEAIDYFMDVVGLQDPVDVQMVTLEEALWRELNTHPLQGNDRIVQAARYVAHVLLAEDDQDDDMIAERIDAFVQRFECSIHPLGVRSLVG